MYKANIFTISFNSNKDLSNTCRWTVCLLTIYTKLTDVSVKLTDVCYWYHLLKTLVWVLSIFISSQTIFYMYKRGRYVLTAIYKYIFQQFTVCFMILKNKNTFVFTFPRIYHRTSYMYKANMFTISLNSENDHSANFSHLLSIFK